MEEIVDKKIITMWEYCHPECGYLEGASDLDIMCENKNQDLDRDNIGTLRCGDCIKEDLRVDGSYCGEGCAALREGLCQLNLAELEPKKSKPGEKEEIRYIRDKACPGE